VLVLLAGPSVGLAQGGGRIAGRVTSAEDGRPLPGVTLMVEGLNRASLSDSTGRYVLPEVPPGLRRVNARRLGLLSGTQQVEVVADQSVTADFVLAASAVQLEAFVTVGYGTQSRRDVTGAISSIKPEDVRQIVATNPLDAIKGRIPGVDITAGSFEPGAADAIRIRGTRSISASNSPLYVVDGVPITGDLRDIDPTSIDRIEVLKDASAAAVYGSRGANGVVMITTKSGTSTGKTEVTFNSTYGLSNVMHEVAMMDALEFANFRRESYRYGGSAAAQAACANYMVNPAPCDQFALDPTMRANLAAGVNTDWQKLMLRTGNLLNNQVGFSGGNQNTRFRAGFGYIGQKGISIVQDYVARSLSLNLSHDYKRLNLQLGVQGVRNFRNAGRGAVMWDEALFNPALGRAYDSTGAPVFL